MNCPACGFANETGRKFCGECGTALATTCPSCGASNAPGMKFCGECGTQLASGPGTAAAQPAEPPTSERRLVSVLFADLVGFTALSEDRDAEAVRELLSRYFEIATRTVDTYGGTVEKFIGDAVMAVWGAPTAHEDDAERAVRAALDLVDRVEQLGHELDADLRLRAGVLTGEAAVTLGAANQGIVAGDLVNTASRLQSVAPPGAVLVGEATYQAASSAIAFEPAGEQLLRGKQAPVSAYHALRVVARRGGAGRSGQLEAPFVGRGPELRMLKDFHQATASERRPRLVSIIGQGGIGKSRLVWEFQKYLDGVTEVVYWHQGRSPAYGDGVSFWALAEMVRARAAIAESDEPSVARRKLTAALDEWVADVAERQWLEPALLHLLGLEPGDSAATGNRESLFAAWRIFFERVAERGVTFLVFEDLQWADDGLLDFVDHVLEWSRDRPIYLITLARPELLDRRPDWGAGRRNFTSLLLEPLDAASMRELLAGLVPGLPETVVERILERAEGVPLYAVETVRMLLGEGKLTQDRSGYRPSDDLTELSVPASLHALIASRLDALGDDDRSLVQAASVLGKTFTVEALAAVSGRPGEEIAERLRSLVRRELLTVEADPRSPERGQYGFVQALIREVAYGTLARRDRRRLHVGAARHFETLDDEGIAGALAEHYLAAYRAQPEGPEGEAVAAQARVALRAAAERARSLGANVQATRFVEQALSVTSDPEERLQLEIAAGRAAMMAGMPDETIQHTQRAMELAREGGDRLKILATLADHATGRAYVSQVAEAVTLLEPARAEFADLANTEPYVRLGGELARCYLLLGRDADALRLVDEILPDAERLELVRATLELLATRGPALANLGRTQESIAVLAGVMSSAASYGMPPTELRARVNLSYAAGAEDPRLAYRVAREGLELARHLGMSGYGYYLLGNAVESAIRSGEWDWALTTAEEAAAEREFEYSAHLRSAEVRGFRGLDVDPTLEWLAGLAASVTEIQVRSSVDDVAAEVALARGQLERARDLARRSYETHPAPDSPSIRTAGRAAAWLGDRDTLAQVHGVLAVRTGRMAAAARHEIEAAREALDGRRREAVIGFVDALRKWRDLGVALDHAICALGMVRLLGSFPGAAEEVAAAAAEAREFFTAVGAQPWLERLDEAHRLIGHAPTASEAPAEAGSGAPMRRQTLVE